MKTRVIQQDNKYFPQYYSRYFGWRYFVLPNVISYTEKEDAIQFCKLQTRAKDNVIWSSDEN